MQLYRLCKMFVLVFKMLHLAKQKQRTHTDRHIILFWHVFLFAGPPFLSPLNLILALTLYEQKIFYSTINIFVQVVGYITPGWYECQSKCFENKSLMKLCNLYLRHEIQNTCWLIFSLIVLTLVELKTKDFQQLNVLD